MISNILIPEERKAILIGTDGKTKTKIERLTKTKIRVGDEILIEGEPLGVIKCENIAKAIGRGFSPQKSLMLLKDDYELEIITIKGTPNTIQRLMARVIGTGGKSRKNLETMTGAQISAYGKTVSLIGTYKERDLSRKAVEMLLSGRKHSYVYNKLSFFFEKEKGYRTQKETTTQM